MVECVLAGPSVSEGIRYDAELAQLASVGRRLDLAGIARAIERPQRRVASTEAVQLAQANVEGLRVGRVEEERRARSPCCPAGIRPGAAGSPKTESRSVPGRMISLVWNSRSTPGRSQARNWISTASACSGS